MARDDPTHRPWSALESLLSSSSPAPRSSLKRRHPNRSILRAYSEESLPERPGAWTRDRVEALAAGVLEEWTRWEVAAHVANCSRCRRAIDGLDRRGWLSLLSGIASLRHILGQPRWAVAGWIFAGMQAAVLVGLLVGGAFSSSPELSVEKTVDYSALDQISQASLIAQVPFVRVEFEPGAPWREVTAWLQSLELEVHGPDAEGCYLLLGEELESNELLQNCWVLRVESVRGGDGE